MGGTASLVKFIRSTSHRGLIDRVLFWRAQLDGYTPPHTQTNFCADCSLCSEQKTRGRRMIEQQMTSFDRRPFVTTSVGYLDDLSILLDHFFARQ